MNTVPDIDGLIGLAHILFVLEDIYEMKVCNDADGVCLRLDPHHQDSKMLKEILSAWREQATKLEMGEITQ